MEIAVNATTTVLGSVPSLLGDYTEAVAYLSQAIASPATMSVVCAACASASALVIRARRAASKKKIATLLTRLPEVAEVESQSELDSIHLDDLDEEQRCIALFHRLPDEILLQILQNVCTTELLSLSQVNRKWASMCTESIRSVSMNSWGSYWADLPDADVNSHFLKLFKRVAPKVTDLHIRLRSVATQSLRLIGAARRVRNLSFACQSSKKISQAIATLPLLDTLSLGCDVTPSVLQPLLSHPSITDLNMNDASISPSNPSAWSGLDVSSLPLQALQIMYLRVPIVSVNKLNQNMHTLHLPWANVAEMQVSHFSHLTSLTSLDLSGFNRTEPFTFLPNMTRLTTLKLSSSTVTDEPLRAVAKMTHLHTLALDRCLSLDGSFLTSITTAMPSLRSLNLSSSNQLEHGIEHLANCGQLESLDLSKCVQITSDKAAIALNSLAMLSYLKVDGCIELDDQIVPAIGRMSRLHTLDLTACSRVSTLPSVMSSKVIENLHLGRTSISGRALSCFSSHSKLRRVELGGLSNLDPSFFVSFVNSPYIGTLDVSGTSISEDCLRTYFTSSTAKYRSINYFNASGCPGVTDKLLHAAFLSSPCISTLKLLECSSLTPDCASSFAALKRVYDLQVGGPAIVDATLKVIGKIETLSSISISSSLITPQGIIDAFATSSARAIYVAPASAFGQEDRTKVSTALPSVSLFWREAI